MTPSLRLSVLLRGVAIVAASVLVLAGSALAQPDPETDPVEAADEDVEEESEDAGDAGVSETEDQPGESAAGPADMAAIPVTTGYKKGFFIESSDGAFQLVTKGRVQGRFTFESNEGEDARDEEGNFAIQRARLTLKGHAFSKDVKYKFQSDFGKGNVTLKDFFVDWKLGGSTYVRIGQYKRPFSRQQVNSSSRLELIDRAITDKAFKSGRDIGFMIHNNYEKSPEIEWAIGVFNATGDGAQPDIEVDDMGNVVDVGFSNVPKLFGPAIVVRGGYNANGIKGYSEADLEGGPLRFGVAASVLAELDADDDDQSSVRAEVDFVLKLEGLSTTGGVYVATAQDDTSFTNQAYDQLGFHVQGGYMLTDNHQVIGRYAIVAPDGGDAKNEITGGFSLYKFKHGLKWQTDVGVLVESGANDLLARTQLQLSF